MLYSDNILGMETCGLPEDLLTEILDDQVQRHLKLQQQAGHLRGCRYNPAARQGCNTRDSSGRYCFFNLYVCQFQSQNVDVLLTVVLFNLICWQ